MRKLAIDYRQKNDRSMRVTIKIKKKKKKKGKKKK